MALNSKQRKKNLLAVFCVASLDNFGFGIVFVMFAPLILNPAYGLVGRDVALGMKNMILGLLFIAYPAIQFFGAPLIGDIGDRFGRKKAFYLTIIGITFGYLLSAIAIAHHSLVWLFISRLISGFCAGNLSICLASIADLSPNEKTRARNFGFVSVIWGFTWPLAMVAGGYLSDSSISHYFSPSLPFYLTIAFALICLILILTIFQETHKKENGPKLDPIKGIHNVVHALRLASLRRYFIVVLFWTVGWGLALQWYGAISIEKFHVTQQAVSWGLVTQGVFWVFGGSVLNPILIKRYPTKIVCLAGLAQASIFVVLASMSNSFMLFTILYALAAIGGPSSLSNALNLLSITASKSIQGKTMGLSQSMMALGWIVVPITGSILGNLNMNLFFPIAAIALMSGWVLLATKKSDTQSGSKEPKN